MAQEEWARTTFTERKRVLECLQRYILDHQEDIARVASRDSGKTCKHPLPIPSPTHGKRLTVILFFFQFKTARKTVLPEPKRWFLVLVVLVLYLTSCSYVSVVGNGFEFDQSLFAVPYSRRKETKETSIFPY